MTGGWARPRNVGHVEDGDVLFVAPLPRGPIYTLQSNTATIWRVAVSGAEDVVAEIARQQGIDPQEISALVNRALDDLERLGLLVRAGTC